MTTKICSAFLVVTLLFAVSGIGLAAPTLPFGRELTPLSEEEMAEVEGEGVLLEIVVGGAIGGVQYLIVTPRDEWNWKDGLLNIFAGALGGWINSLIN